MHLVAVVSAQARRLTSVLASDGLAGGGARGVDSTALADVDDGGVGASLDGGPAGLGSVCVGELDRAEVGKRNQGETLLKVLNDPLGIILAQVALSTGEGVGDRLSSGGVLKCSSALASGSRLNGHDDGVTGGDVKVEIVGIICRQWLGRERRREYTDTDKRDWDNVPGYHSYQASKETEPDL